MQLDIGSR